MYGSISWNTRIISFERPSITGQRSPTSSLDSWQLDGQMSQAENKQFSVSKAQHLELTMATKDKKSKKKKSKINYSI